MKQRLLQKTLLLLFALIAGSTSVWADEVLSWSRSGSTDSYTDGFTFATNKISSKSGYYQDSGSAGSTTTTLTLYHETDKLFATTPGSITFTATLGGGSMKDPLDNNIYACFVDNTGADIAGTEVTVTTKITSTSSIELFMVDTSSRIF